MSNVDVAVKRSSQKVYRGRELERSYRLFPKKTVQLDKIDYDPSLDESVEGKYAVRINRQLKFYKENGFFEDDILVSLTKTDSNSRYVLEAGYPIFKAMSIIGLEEAEVRVKVQVDKEKATKLVDKRLEKHEKAISKFKELDEKMEKLRQLIKTCDADMFDLMHSVDEDLKSQIKKAHYVSLNTPHIYKKSLKVPIYKKEQ
ncbi:hypothetical protein [Priestia aryabhattai]|uniref:hypothetical protein n=1 Tax=Priestia aryabhattai TaxID=412384 RepID=UPI001C2469CD|nr:hypothetical protein [Bacillus sp. FJAT-26377]